MAPHLKTWMALLISDSSASPILDILVAVRKAAIFISKAISPKLVGRLKISPASPRARANQKHAIPADINSRFASVPSSSLRQ